MRAMTWAAAALVLAFATACDDRSRSDTANRADNAAEEVGADIREGADDAGDAVSGAADDTRDAAGDAADDVGDAAGNAADDVGDAVDNATDGLDDYSYDRRDDFRSDVQKRLDALDRELEAAEGDLNADASQTRKDAVAAAREARQAVDRSFGRVGNATRENWDGLREEIGDALGAAELRVRELRPDSKPMGGTGGPS